MKSLYPNFENVLFELMYVLDVKYVLEVKKFSENKSHSAEKNLRSQRGTLGMFARFYYVL